MAGDWIKMRVDLYRDPKVCVIADALMDEGGELARYVNQIRQRDMTVTRNVTRNVTVGALVTVWGVMRHRGKRDGDDLVCRGVSIAVIDDVADLPGFGTAMASVGWVVETDKGIVFPAFFDEYNVDPNEKKASAAAERQRRYRERKQSESDVTRDVTRDVTVTHREEKRREEIKDTPISPSGDSSAAASDNAAILDSYHTILPACQRIEVLNPKRRKRLAAAVKLAKQVCASQGWDYVPGEFWPAYWTQCAADKWMRGEVPNPNNPAWKQNLDVLLAEDRFASVMDKAIAAMRGDA